MVSQVSSRLPATSQREPGCTQCADAVLSESISRRLETGEFAWKGPRGAQGALEGLTLIGAASDAASASGTRRVLLETVTSPGRTHRG